MEGNQAEETARIWMNPGISRGILAEQGGQKNLEASQESGNPQSWKGFKKPNQLIMNFKQVDEMKREKGDSFRR